MPASSTPCPTTARGRGCRAAIGGAAWDDPARQSHEVRRHRAVGEDPRATASTPMPPPRTRRSSPRRCELLPRRALGRDHLVELDQCAEGRRPAARAGRCSIRCGWRSPAARTGPSLSPCCLCWGVRRVWTDYPDALVAEHDDPLGVVVAACCTTTGFGASPGAAGRGRGSGMST